MNKSDIKSAIGRLEPDEELEHRIYKVVSEKPHKKFVFKYCASAAVSITMVVVCALVIGYNFTGEKSIPIPSIIKSTKGVYIPKIELQKGSNANADMIGVIVYQGKIYILVDTRIDSENAEKLHGEKLGTTIDTINEWSNQKDYAVEFASNAGNQDVYTVNGYDKSFRIMTYEKIDGIAHGGFYECFNGITVKNGNDVFGLMKIENHIKTAKYESLDSWNYNNKQYKEIVNLRLLNSFVNELNNTVPYKMEGLSNLFESIKNTNQKFIYITLDDGCEIQLRLFRDGYIFYNSAHILFKMDDKAFNEFWNELK